MPASIPYLDRAGRIVSVTMSDDMLDRLDAQRLLDAGHPARAAQIREAVELWLNIKEDPEASVLMLAQGLRALHADGLGPDLDPIGTA
jgi:hypothetical protein